MGAYVICTPEGVIKHEGLRLVDAHIMTQQYNEQEGEGAYLFMSEDRYLAKFVKEN